MSAVRLRGLAFAVALLALIAIFYRLSAAPPPKADPQVSESADIYFTRPAASGPRSLRGGPDAALVEAIDDARQSVDMAIYDLDLYSVRDALLRSAARGVSVRLVVESDNLDSPELHELIAAGIPLVADGGEALMHDKFTVIDSRQVWTGSMNYTVNDAYFNDNNLVRLSDPVVGEVYGAEFEEMFRLARFGELSGHAVGPDEPLRPGSSIEIYFAPDDRVAERVVELIDGAGQEVVFLAFSLTAEDISRALQRRAAAGVEVRGVMDAGQSANLGSRYEELLQDGIDVRLDGNPDRMHHKVIVIDGETVITGSYNFSRSAETQNDENLVVLHDPAAAAAFLDEFERVYALAAP